MAEQFTREVIIKFIADSTEAVKAAKDTKERMKELGVQIQKSRDKADELRLAMMRLKDANEKAGKAGTKEAKAEEAALKELETQVKKTYTSWRQQLKALEREATAAKKAAAQPLSTTMGTSTFSGIVKGALVGRVVREIFDAISSIKDLYVDIVRKSMEWNTELTLARIGMAAMIAQGHDLYLNGAKVTDGVEKYGLSLRKAEELQRQMLVVSNQQIITYEELNAVATAGMALLTARGVPLEKQVELLALILSSEKAIGIQKQQQFMEMKQLLQGDIRRGELARQLVALGKITKDELTRLSGEALYQKLTTALAEMAVAGEAHMNTIMGQWEILTDNMKFSLASVFDDPNVKSSVVGLIQQITDKFFVKVQDSSTGKSFMALTLEGEKLLTVIKNLVDWVAKLVSWFADTANIEFLVTMTKAIGVFVALTGSIIAVSTVMGGLVALFEVLATKTHWMLALLSGLTMLITAVYTGTQVFNALSLSVGAYTDKVVMANGETYTMSENLAQVGAAARQEGDALKSLWERYLELKKAQTDVTKPTAELVELSKQIAQSAPDAAMGINKMTGEVTLLNSEVEKTIIKLQSLEKELAKAIFTEMEVSRRKMEALDKQMMQTTQRTPADVAFRESAEMWWAIQDSPLIKRLISSSVTRGMYGGGARETMATGTGQRIINEKIIPTMNAILAKVRESGNDVQAGLEAFKRDLEAKAANAKAGLMSADERKRATDAVAIGYQVLADMGHTAADEIATVQSWVAVQARVAGSIGIYKPTKETIEALAAARVKEQAAYNIAQAQWEGFSPEAQAAASGLITTTSTAPPPPPPKGTGKSVPAWDVSALKLQEELARRFIEQLRILLGIYEDPLWKEQSKNYEEEAKTLDKARIAALAKLEAAKVTGDTTASAEGAQELLDITQKEIELDSQRMQDQKSIAELYMRQAGITKENANYQNVLNSLISAGGKDYAQYLIAQEEVTKAQAKLQALQEAKKTVGGKDADEKLENEKKIDAEIAEAERQLTTAQERFWQEGRQYHASILARRIADVRKAADRERETAEEVEKAKKKAIDDTNKFYTDMIRSQIDDMNAVRTTMEANLDTLETRAAIIEERYRQGMITADEYEKAIKDNKKQQEEVHALAIKNMEIEIGKALVYMSVLNMTGMAGTSLWKDLAAAIAKGDKELEKLILAQLRLNKEVATTCELMAGMFGAIEGVLSKFGGADSVFGKLISDAGDLFDAFSKLKGVEFFGKNAGKATGIGDFFSKAFSNGWTGFLTALPNLISIGSAIGSMFMGIMDGIMALFERKAERIYKRLQKELESLMEKYRNEALNIKDAIASLEALRARSIAELSGEKGGDERLKKLLPEIDKELAAIRKEQKRIFDDMDASLKKLRIQSNLRDIFTQYDEVIKKYKEYIDAGGNLVKAQEYLTLSFADMTRKLQEEYDDALQTYHDDIEDEMDRWLKGAEDDWGRLVSLEKKAQLDILKAIQAYNEGVEERAKERAQILEDLAEFERDKEKEIQDIQNEGLLERRKTTEQSKLDRIAAIQEEIEEKRKEARERLAELDEQDKKEKELLDQELSRINLRMQREREAHDEKMAMLEAENQKSLENLRQQMEYLNYLIANWETYYEEGYVNPETLARLREQFAWFIQHFDDAMANEHLTFTQGGGDFSKVWSQLGNKLSDLLTAEMTRMGFTDAASMAAAKKWPLLKDWLAAHPNILVYLDDKGEPHFVDISEYLNAGSSGSAGTGATTGAAESGSTQGGGAGGGAPAGGGLVDLAEWAAMGGTGGATPSAAGAIGQQNNVIVTVNVTGVPVNPDTVEQHIYDQVINALDTAYRR